MSSVFRFHKVLAANLLVVASLQVAGCSSPETRAQQHFERAQKLLADHETAKAAIELKNAIRLKKDLVGAWRTLAELDEKAGDWPHVAADLRAIVDLAPDDVGTRVKLGKILLMAGSTGEALKLAEAGLQRNNSADLHALKAAIAIRLGDSDQAGQEAQTALAADPNSVDATIVLAIQRMGKGDSEGALSLLDRDDSADFKGSKLGLQLLKINLLERTGDLEALERTLRELTESAPNELTYRSLLSSFYVGRGHPDTAEQVLRDYADQHPSDIAGSLTLARFLLKTRNSPAQAREALEAGIRANGNLFPLEMGIVDVDVADGRLDDGRRRLEALLEKDGNAKQARQVRLALAQLALKQKDFDGAEARLAELLRDARDASALKLRASLRIQRRQYEGAITDLVEAINLEPRSTELMLLLATAYERSGLIELADKQFADASRASNFDQSIGQQYVAFLQRRGLSARAEDVIQQLMARRPNDVQLSLMLAQIKMARQNWDGVQEIAASIKNSGNSSLADQLVGMMLLQRNRLDDATATLRRAHEAAPKALDPLKLLVAALNRAHRTDEAEAVINSAVAENPQDANLLVLRASVGIARGDPTRVLSDLRAAVSLEPKNPAGYQALAEFFLSRKEYDEAIRTLRTEIGELPDAPNQHLLLARALEQKGDFESAMSEYEELLDREPGNLIAINNLAALIFEQRTDQASLKKAESIAAALRKSPVPEFKDTLCWANYLQGDYRKALSQCEEAAAALPDQASVQYHYAMALIAVGQSSKASTHLKRALDLAPDDKLSAEIRAAIEKTAS
ncbi:tetratricopeptide repeat protein [Bradyrhizobium sp. HKCCYLS1011]|uniref:tetratricopeptide repeat protein n=1 Tax=Bradyrhizobium sp. HKCCYLS1011 TaxID=3420733 RepID=UPI003EBC42B7